MRTILYFVWLLRVCVSLCLSLAAKTAISTAETETKQAQMRCVFLYRCSQFCHLCFCCMTSFIITLDRTIPLLDWPTIVLQCFDAVGWVIWPIKIVPDMTYNVFGGTLNPTLLLHYTNASSLWYVELCLKWL